jgi:hypothetical protein
MMEFTRISRKYVHIPVTATLADGNPAPLAGVDVTLLPVNHRPDADTAWTAADYADGVGTVLIAGPDADPDGALPLAADADLWIRVTDTPEVDAVKVTRMSMR